MLAAKGEAAPCEREHRAPPTGNVHPPCRIATISRQSQQIWTCISRPERMTIQPCRSQPRTYGHSMKKQERATLRLRQREEARSRE